jgi:hypothetical protein
MAGAAVLAVALPGPALARQPAGEVTLPLERYLDLVARAERETVIEPEVAAVTRQLTRVTITADAVRARTEIELLVRGADLAPVPLAIAGTIESVRVEPEGGGSVGWPRGPAPPSPRGEPSARGDRPARFGPVFFARRAGAHRLVFDGRLLAPGPGGAVRVELPAAGAPLSVAEVSLPATLAWSAPGAIVVSDEATDGTRRLVLALPSDRVVPFSARRAGIDGGDETLANTVAATRIEVGALGWVRSDAVLYEISRGTIASLALTTPAALEVERAVTNSGSALLIDEGSVDGGSIDGGPIDESDDGASPRRRLRVEPEQPLAGIAFVRLEQRPSTAGAGLDLDGAVDLDGAGDVDGGSRFEIPLGAVRPRIEPRARYLLVSSSVAAELIPEPAAAWQRVDRADLPPALASALPGAPSVSVWRRVAGNGGTRAADGVLHVARAPLAQRSETLIRSRSSTTLLTPEGTVVQRESLSVASRAGSLSLELPEDAVVWMARVGGVLVRPVVEADRRPRARTVRLPLAGAEGESVEVELLSVAEGAVPPGRTELRFALPVISAPVLVHEWRLLLPADARYRFAGGDLLPVAPAAAPRPIGIDSSGSGDGLITGTVRDRSGLPLPGAQVTLTLDGTRRLVITDAQGRYGFSGVEPGRGMVSAELEEFTPEQTNVRIRRRGAARADFVLGPGTEETITVTSEAPLVDQFEAQVELEKIPTARDPFSILADDLRQGMVGGVRPLEVEIPERGKLLLLSGVLPPAQVTATLEARRPR